MGEPKKMTEFRLKLAELLDEYKVTLMFDDDQCIWHDHKTYGFCDTEYEEMSNGNIDADTARKTRIIKLGDYGNQS